MVLKLGERRVDLLIVKETVLPTRVDHFVANAVLAYLTLQRLVAVVIAMRGLKFDSFASEPVFEALEVNVLYGPRAETGIEEGI